MITHRCKSSLKNGCSIRFIKDILENNPKWFIGRLSFDSEYDDGYMAYLHAPISYCPFWGKKLEVEE